MGAQDLAGQVFNRLTVLERNGTSADRKALWRCRCTCGQEVTVSGKRLRTGHTRSCGCLQKERASQTSRLNLVGQVFGRLTVLEDAGTAGEGRRLASTWRCRCECGTELVVAGNSLTTGNTRSCGCLKREEASARRNVHLEGRRFGRLVVIKRDGFNKFGHALWLCQCDCGAQISTDSGRLNFGTVRSCGCFQKDRASEVSRVDILGQRFGMLTVIADAGSKPMARGALALWECACDCGNKTVVPGVRLRSGNTKSCGCVASHAEKEILGLVRDWLPGESVLGDRLLEPTGYRYDVICPEKRIAIEYNGVYWHSAPFKERGYHVSKRTAVEASGYRLISIWEDDWKAQRDKYIALLRRVLQLDVPQLVGARRLDLRKILPRAANAFHEQYHLQGRTRGSRHLGAFLDGELLAVGSFFGGIPKSVSSIERYTLKTGVASPGLLLRMLKALPWRRYVTHCDRDHFDGGVYRASGFRLVSSTPQLRFSDGQQRHHRQRFMKHQLPALGIDLQPGESASAALARHGLQECWNSGIDTWELEL